MSRNYRFHNPDGLYFVSFAIVYWLDVFINDEYKNILLDSISFCKKEKGMEVIAWCIMNTHVHLIFRSLGDQEPGRLLGDLKRFTSKSIVKSIKYNPKEYRKEIFFQQFNKVADNKSKWKNNQFWQHENKTIELWSNTVIQEKVNYVHQNPVEAGLVYMSEDYAYSSARDYAGEKGLLEDVLVYSYYG